ncbi:MAG: nuclear transport factor 2 family protein [Bacteroidota bacterium]
MNSLTIDLANLKKDNWSDQDLNKAEHAVAFVQKIMNDHDFDYVVEHYAHHPYKQHNMSMADGIGGVVQSMRELCAGFPEFSYDVRHIYVDGDYVTLHSHATLTAADRSNPQKGFNIYDTWKIEGVLLVEHWDAIQGIDKAMRELAVQGAGLVRNENTLF